jgi:hypothetical protein
VAEFFAGSTVRMADTPECTAIASSFLFVADRAGRETIA